MCRGQRMAGGEKGAQSSRRPPLHRGEGRVVKSPLEHHSTSRAFDLHTAITPASKWAWSRLRNRLQTCTCTHSHTHALYCMELTPRAALYSKWCTVSSREPEDERRPWSPSDPNINDGWLRLILFILLQMGSAWYVLVTTLHSKQEDCGSGKGNLFRLTFR